MNVRDLSKLSELQISELDLTVGDRSVVSVSVETGKDGKVDHYLVKLQDCTIIQCVGHDRIQSLKYPQPARPSFIQTYGEFGSSLGGRPYRGY